MIADRCVKNVSKICQWRKKTGMKRIAASFCYSNNSNNGDDFLKNPPLRSALEITRDIAAKLKIADVPEPELSARHLVASAAKLNFGGLKDDHELCEGDIKRLSRMVECRLARVPIQYIVGNWDFRSLILKTRPPVFIPRPETEQLVEAVLDRTHEGCRILDVGCGTGAVALSLLKEGPDSTSVVAVDQSSAACLLTMENAVDNGLDLERFAVHRSKLLSDGNFKGDILLSEKLDVIVSNPPYVLRKDLSELEPEITLYEDLRALDGGKDGLDIIKALLNLADARLRVGGYLVIETDPCHSALLPQTISFHANLSMLEYRKDFRGKDRFAIFEKNKIK